MACRAVIDEETTACNYGISEIALAVLTGL